MTSTSQSEIIHEKLSRPYDDDNYDGDDEKDGDGDDGDEDDYGDYVDDLLVDTLSGRLGRRQANIVRPNTCQSHHHPIAKHVTVNYAADT